jgi:hypothetical protein
MGEGLWLLPLMGVEMPGPYSCSEDATAINNPNGSGYTSDWNANGVMSPIGVNTNGTILFRARMQFTGFSSTGIQSVTNAKLKLYYYHSGTSSNNAGNSGTSTNRIVQVYLANSTNSIVDTGGGTPFPASGWTSKSGYNWETQFANGTYYSGISATETISGVTANGTLVEIDVTNLIQYLIANPGFTFRGFLLKLDAEGASNTNSFVQFYSRNSSFPPVLETTEVTNVAPNAPVNLSPTGGAIVTSKVLSGTLSDPDNSDSLSAVQVQIASDSGFTSIVYDSGTVSDTGTTFSVTHNASLTYNTTYYWRARTKDLAGIWGPYSSGDTFKQNTKPNTPSGLTPTGGVVVPTLTPTFSGQGSDPDPGDSIATARIRVYRTSDNTLMWDSGDFASGVASFTKQYGNGGTVYFNLSYGTSYYWNATVKDTNSASSSTSSSSTFATDIAGVTGMTPNISNGVTGWVKTLTPAFNFVTPANMNQYTLKIYDTNNTLIRTIGPTAVSPVATTLATDYTYSGSPVLEYGTRYQWTVTWRDTSNVTQPESVKAAFWTNAAPVSNNISPTNNQAITSINPVIQAAFADQDLANGFEDSPTALSIEVSATDGTVMYTMAKTASLESGVNGLSQGASGVTTTAGAGGTTLTKNVQYRYRSRYTDNSGASNAQGSYTDYVFFKPTDGPTISSLAVDASDLTTGKINNSIPLLSYTYTAAFGKAQKSRRLRIIETSSGNSVRYDSGFILTADASFDAPADIILNNATYKFEVTVQDSDDIESSTISVTYVALWNAPAVITGLSIEQGNGTLKLTWDQSADASFTKYNVYRRNYGSSVPYEFITSIQDIGTVNYTDFSAGIGARYEYKVTQTSTPVGSNPVDSDIDATTLTVGASIYDNWFIVYEGNEALGVELYVDSEDRTNPYQEEIFEPFGRSKKVVVRYGQYGVEGNISAYIPNDEAEVKLSKIKQLFELSVPLYLKTPFGDVYKVYFSTPSYQYATGGTVKISVGYIEVD